MGDVTITIPAEWADLIRHICIYEFVKADDLSTEAEKHWTCGMVDKPPKHDVGPLIARLAPVYKAKSVLDEIGWAYGEPPKVDQITADREWLKEAIHWQRGGILDLDGGHIETTDDMRWCADAADFLGGILDNIGWPEQKKAEAVA